MRNKLQLYCKYHVQFIQFKFKKESLYCLNYWLCWQEALFSIFECQKIEHTFVINMLDVLKMNQVQPNSHSCTGRFYPLNYSAATLIPNIMY
jgi:hypothetical protein